MSIDIECFDSDQFEEWDRIVDRSPQTTVFHQSAALEVLAAESGTDLHPLVGFKGQEPVAVFPLFELSKGPLTAVFSPPPNLWIPKLGPAFLNMAKLKQRKRGRRRQRFVDTAFDWLDGTLGPQYVRVRTNNGLSDVRPFKWNDCSVTPEFTYVTELLEDEQPVLDRFSGDARSNIRKGGANSDTYTIREEGADAAVEIMEQVKARYSEQDEPFPVPADFPRKLYERLPEGQIRPYIYRSHGEFVGGILAYDYDGTVARWHGGVRPSADMNLPVNDLLDWRLIRDAIERGRQSYDLVGAGDPRLTEYKAKFAPALESFYSVERGSIGISQIMRVYRLLSG